MRQPLFRADLPEYCRTACVELHAVGRRLIHQAVWIGDPIWVRQVKMKPAIPSTRRCARRRPRILCRRRQTAAGGGCSVWLTGHTRRFIGRLHVANTQAATCKQPANSPIAPGTLQHHDVGRGELAAIDLHLPVGDPARHLLSRHQLMLSDSSLFHRMQRINLLQRSDHAHLSSTHLFPTLDPFGRRKPNMRRAAGQC